MQCTLPLYDIISSRLAKWRLALYRARLIIFRWNRLSPENSNDLRRRNVNDIACHSIVSYFSFLIFVSTSIEVGKSFCNVVQLLDQLTRNRRNDALESFSTENRVTTEKRAFVFTAVACDSGLKDCFRGRRARRTHVGYPAIAHRGFALRCCSIVSRLESLRWKAFARQCSSKLCDYNTRVLLLNSLPVLSDLLWLTVQDRLRQPKAVVREIVRTNELSK